jgi:hypothetical protein
VGKKGGMGGEEGGLTRFELYSTHIEFLAGLVMSWPATVGTMSEGGMCRSPGPRRRGFFGWEGIRDGSIVSPGRTSGRSFDMLAVWWLGFGGVSKCRGD